MSPRRFARLLCHAAAWALHAQTRAALEARAAALTGGEPLPPTDWDAPDFLRHIRRETSRLWR